VISQRQIV